MPVIELRELTRGEVRNLTGHARGLAARDQFELDRLDEDERPVKVVVPPELDALTSSFFQGMFSKSVKKFRGREKFLGHYLFDANDAILKQVERGIARVCTERGSAL